MGKIRDIVMYGDPVLRTKGEPVEAVTEEVRDFLCRLVRENAGELVDSSRLSRAEMCGKARISWVVVL